MKTSLSALFLLLVAITSAQVYNKDFIQKENEKLKRDLIELDQKLRESRNLSKTSLVYVKNLNEKIKVQNSLVSGLSKEKTFIEDDIYLSQLKINKLKRELGSLKEDFKDVLVHAYKNKSVENKLLFVLSSDSFLQAYRRIKYLEKYSEFQNRQVDDILLKQKAIEKEIAKKEVAKKDKQLVLNEQVGFKDELDLQLNEKQKVVNEFKRNEGKIVAEINQKKAQQRKNNKILKDLIAKEIAEREKREAEERKKLAAEKAKREAEAKKRREAEEKERQRLAEAAKAKAEAEAKAAGASEAETKEAIAKATPPPAPEPKPEPKFDDRTSSEKLSDNFEANRGSLPWPVSKGTVVLGFGTQAHPILPGIVLENNGVDIAAPKNSPAKCIFNGQVVSINAIPGSNKTVLISHGDYYSVYNNLKNVYVSEGEKISRGQNIGTIYTDADGQTILNFMMYKKEKLQNPSSWIGGM